MHQLYNLVITVLSAAAYFYFNWRYFCFVQLQTQMPRLRVRFVLLCFVLNYLLFGLCTAMEFPLIANWSVFAVALFFQTMVYTGADRRCALFSTITGITCGLSINIFCRAVISIVTGLPLQNFDNRVSQFGNLKGIPVLLGFLLAGTAMHLLTRPLYMERLRMILRYPQHQMFLLELMAGLLLYLYLNLILYSAPFNDLLFKAWAVKSCLFSVIGYYIATWYTWRICVLTNYHEKNQALAHELASWQQIVPRLRQDAVQDALTGLYNRQYAEDVLSRVYAQNLPFVLCFVDLDGLKQMNDCCGHDVGDRYLRTVSAHLRRVFRRDQDLLFRYGGDEFLCLVRGLSAEEAAQRLDSVNAALAAQDPAEGFPLPVSISYGAVESSRFPDAAQLITAADQKMYAQKQCKRRQRDSRDG